MQIINKQMDGQVLKGEVLLPGRAQVIQVAFEPDEEIQAPDDEFYAYLISRAAAFVASLSPEAEMAVKEQVSAEITDAAYSQDDEAPIGEAYAQLRDDLQLQQISFFPDDMVWTYSAGTIFAGNIISVQIGYDLEIIEVMVLD